MCLQNVLWRTAMATSLRRFVVLVLLVAFATSFQATPTARATPAPTVARAGMITWQGGGGDASWSNPTNWAGDRVPGPTDIVRFAAGRPADALVDAAFAGTVAGLVLDDGYRGTLTLARDLDITGALEMSSGNLAGGASRLTVTREASVRGG